MITIQQLNSQQIKAPPFSSFQETYGQENAARTIIASKRFTKHCALMFPRIDEAP